MSSGNGADASALPSVQVVVISGSDDPQMHPGTTLLDREISWLAFNERVLTLAADPTLPLLERVAFCAIFGTNLDEFYEVRVAGLKDQLDAFATRGSGGEGAPRSKLEEIGSEVARLTGVQARVLSEIRGLLAKNGIAIVSVGELDDGERRRAAQLYRDLIYPVLTPLAVDPGHPFPYISNLSLNLAVTIRSERRGDPLLFARVKVPPSLPRFVPIGDDHSRFVRIEDLIAAEMGSLFPGLTVESTHAFRVTRNADIDLDGSDAEDLLMAVETELRRRRFGRAVRLEVAGDMPADILALLIDELDLDAADVTRTDGWLGLGSLWSLARLERPDLRYEPWIPVVPPRLGGSNPPPDMFTAIRGGDLLVHHPYDSFASTVERFIAEAAADPKVLAIKLTLYRTSGDGQIVESLIRAVGAGKQVAVLVELTARFDELANITWARKLEEAGVHVVYGVLGLKTHTKIALVVRDDGEGGVRRYCHVATGNYNATTARIYEDIGMFSCDPVLADDLSSLFNALTGYGMPGRLGRVLVAPHTLRLRMLELIAGEHPTDTRGPGRIVMKMNSLVDPEMIEALYEASRQGVSIDLIIRGICCLRPLIPGMSENIRVRSIVGRYLEHSRIYHFAHGASGSAPAWFIGSADLMQRNLDHRVEAVVDVIDPALTAELGDLIALLLHPDVSCWHLDGDGRWHRFEGRTADDRSDSPDSPQHIRGSGVLDVHRELQRIARARSDG